MMKRKWTSASRVSVLAAVVTALGAFVWSGCGPSNDGSYYCDQSGCYSCDGYSCRDVPSPAAPPCSGDSTCGSGSICTDQGCVQGCAADNECPHGTVCTTGLCVAPGKPPGAPKGCTGASDCAANQACVAGVCTAAANACKYASECAPGKVCADGQCLDDCSSASCGTGFSCVKGACEPVPSGTGCTTSTTCPSSAPRCVGGQCTASCANDGECPSGDYCSQGACVLDTRPKPDCTSCASTQQCVDGYCRYSCTDDDTCKRIDARIGYCGSDKVCRTESEAHPQCTSKSDCPGQTCIDNKCK